MNSRKGELLLFLEFFFFFLEYFANFFRIVYYLSIIFGRLWKVGNEISVSNIKYYKLY